MKQQRTRGQGLSELLCLFSVVGNEGVKETGAADLELGDWLGTGVTALGLLHAGSCKAKHSQ